MTVPRKFIKSRAGLHSTGAGGDQVASSTEEGGSQDAGVLKTATLHRQTPSPPQMRWSGNLPGIPRVKTIFHPDGSRFRGSCLRGTDSALGPNTLSSTHPQSKTPRRGQDIAVQTNRGAEKRNRASVSESWSSRVAQRVKNPAWSLPCCGLIPGPGTSACLGHGQRKKK